MAGQNKRTSQSMETILNFENRDLSQWSVVWSTSHIPGMDNATGGGPRRRIAGRRRLRLGSLAIGALLTMHCRVTASALTGGIFVFMMFLILAVAALANPLRHFEAYLGQWSISGPGRAFRIIPMLDGIGIAICINAIVRAIYCCSVAAIAAVYVGHSISDARLPFTYCRDFDLKTYEPIMKDVRTVMPQESRFAMEAGIFDDDPFFEENTQASTVGMLPEAWRNFSIGKEFQDEYMKPRTDKPRQIAVCNEQYSGSYPPLYSTPAYNYFYVEVVQLRNDFNLGQFNLRLVLSHVLVWSTLWGLMISERIRHGRLIWNNLYKWFVIVPWVWTAFLSLGALSSLMTINKSLRKIFRIGAKELLAAVADALEVGLYIHSVSVGTEMIHGKGLNHYASGHVDPFLHGEVLWHSALLLIVSGMHLAGAALCALVDCIQPSSDGAYNMRESTLWILPMYSKCASLGNYSHFMTTIIFGGLMFSYMTIAFVLLKTALHTIFEYRVKLVFVEQVIVGALILTCMGLSLIFTANGGIALLESVDSLMTGLAVPYVCILELIGMLYVYRGHDFLSDLNLATDETTCVSPMSFLWHTMPFITLGTLIVKAVLLVYAEMPSQLMLLALAPLLSVVIAVPLRACHNVYAFLNPNPRRGT